MKNGRIKNPAMNFVAGFFWLNINYSFINLKVCVTPLS